jgi:organic hydroperoxide reductase OsmC/OhrA
MDIRARVEHAEGKHDVALQTNGIAHALVIAPKAVGGGSSVNGGELLCLALATCYCNDLYREAARQGVQVLRVTVEVQGNFPAEGAPATHLTYSASVTARASAQAIRELMAHTDRVAEVQNTLRAATPVTLGHIEAISV